MSQNVLFVVNKDYNTMLGKMGVTHEKAENMD